MHEDDERLPSEKSHAYHFSITCNGCEFCLQTAPAILALPKAYLKDRVCKFVVPFAYDPVLVIAIEIVRYCTKMSTKNAKHKKLLNLLCIV